MGRKKNECGFSIPWISSPSTESSKQKQKQKQKQKSDRPPFRPPGIASASPQPKMELELSNSTAKAEPPTTTTTTTTTTYIEKKMMFGASNEDIKAVTPPSTRNKINVSTIPLSTEEEDQEKQVSTLASAEDKTVSVVTLAGDNRGVTMHVAGSHSLSKEKKDEETGKAYVNSNIQSINNSIMSNGSINGRDPGVRVVLPQPQQQVEKKNDEVISIKRAERLPYQPVVRRRCLRGLFLEPSDSEADNKPRRHGCKFSCGGDASKDHNKDIAVPK